MRLELLSPVYNLVATDTIIVAQFAPVSVAQRMNYRMAKRDSPFPYINYLVSADPGYSDGVPMRSGHLSFSVYDQGPSCARRDRIADRIIQLFGPKSMPGPPDPTKILAFRVYDPQDLEVETQAEDIWRRDLVFPIRFFDQATALAAVARDP